MNYGNWQRLRSALMAGTLLALPTPALAQGEGDAIAVLRAELAVLRAEVAELRRVQAATTPANAAVPANPVPLASPPLAVATPVPAPAAAAAAAPPKKAWYDRIQVRGYVQMRVNEVLSDRAAVPAGISRLRSVHDSAVGEPGNFTLRRARLVVQGDVSDRFSIYMQGDLAAAVNAQSNGERREHFFQLRDAYGDVHFADRTVKVRLGQSKVPFGWENLQSSSNRLSLDRADAANSAVPGERDLGVVVYYTPPAVQRVWDRLAKDGQKLFGNYGAFGVGIFNGQGINRTEKNDGLMKVALATWPFELDGLGGAFRGQVLELGVQGMLNRIQPELRSGGVSAASFADNRVNLHAVLYPAPFGLQAEWTFGRSAEWSPARLAIGEGNLRGGYVQAMYRIKDSAVGPIMPYARVQTYRGGWKAATNAPRISTDEIELGVEWQPLKEVELTMAYARMKRAEADERRTGRAVGDVLRAQVQFSY